MSSKRHSLGLYSPFWGYTIVNTVSVIEECLENKLLELKDNQKEVLKRSLSLFDYLTLAYKSNLNSSDIRKIIKFNTLYSGSISDEAVDILRIMEIPLREKITEVSKQLTEKFNAYAKVIKEMLDYQKMSEENKVNVEEVKEFFNKIVEVRETKTY